MLNRRVGSGKSVWDTTCELKTASKTAYDNNHM